MSFVQKQHRFQGALHDVSSGDKNVCASRMSTKLTLWNSEMARERQGVSLAQRHCLHKEEINT